MAEIEAKAEWSDAEKWAWARIVEGEVADFSAAYGELEPRSGEGWTAQRSLRPAFLGTILFDKAWHDHIPVSGIRIVGARWAGPLILTHGTVNRPLVLDRCRFEGRVDLTGCRFAWRLSFQRSAFCAAEEGPSLIFDQVSAARGDFCRSYFGNGARGEDSVFATTLDFTGTGFEGALALKGAHVGSLLLLDASATDLDFRDLEADGNVNLRGAGIAGTMDMSSSIVGQELELGANKERQASFAKEIRLFNTVVKGSVTFVGASAGGPVNMNGIDIQRNLFMRAPLDIDEEKCPTIFAKGVDLTAARINGTIDMSGARFGGLLSLNMALVGGAVFATRAHFSDEIDCVSLQASGSVNFNGALVRRLLNLADAQIGHLNLRDLEGRRILCRRVTVDNAVIQGQFVFAGTCVGPMSLNALRVRDGVFVRDFSADQSSPPRLWSKVDLSFASLQGHCELDGAVFAGSLSLTHAKVERNLWMKIDLRSPLNLSSSDISGHLTLSTTTDAFVDMGDIHVGQDLFLYGEYRTPVKLSQARIDRMLDVQAELAMLDLSGAVIGGEARIPLPQPRPSAGPHDPKVRLDLRDAKVGSLQIRDQPPFARPSGWPEEGSVQLDGFTVDRLGGYGVVDQEEMAAKPAQWFRRWLALDHPYSPQPYEHLTAVLRQGGQAEKANSILWYGRERARAASTGLRWLGLTLLKGSIGYGIGYRYFYALGWALLLTAVGVGVLVLSGSADHAPLLQPLWQKIFYSFDQLLPIIELNGEFSKITLKGWSQAYFYCHKLIGFLLGTFIAAGIAGLTQKSRS